MNTCTKCGASTAFRIKEPDPTGYMVIRLSDHGEERGTGHAGARLAEGLLRRL